MSLDRQPTAEEQELGRDLSLKLKWDGFAILRAASVALEDANFHAECARVLDMIGSR